MCTRVSTNNEGGDVGSHVGNCIIITHTMGDRGVIGTGLSLVIYTHVQRRQCLERYSKGFAMMSPCP